MSMRSGDEPGHARSPLRLRLGLAGFGLIASVLSALVVRTVAPLPVVLAFLLIAVIAAVDLVIVGRQLRQGAHFQPGPTVPPYRPVEPEVRVERVRPPLTESDRMRRYLTLMVICLTLIVLAWFWVRLYSTVLAVAMSMVAAVLPPIAVIVANFGIRLPTQPSPEPNQDDKPDAGRPDAPGGTDPSQ
jgi:uncharacterized protein DUF6343/DUF3099 family protein